RKTTPSSDRHRDPIIQFPVTSHGGGVNGPPDPYPLPSTEPPSECPAAINVDLDTEANSKTLTAVNRDSFTVSQVRCIVCSSTLHGGGRRKTSRRDSGPKRTAIYRARSENTSRNTRSCIFRLVVLIPLRGRPLQTPTRPPEIRSGSTLFNRRF
ncbi:hypothetical protein HID58_092768, partial [Brassica napus]